MSDNVKKRLVTGKSFAKILGVVMGGFFGVIFLALGIMYLTGYFDKPKIMPENIEFEISAEDLITENGKVYLSPQIMSVNEQSGEYEVADYFFVNPKATNEDATEMEVTLSVSNNDVIKLESNKAKLGEPIKIIICKDENTGIPYGGYSSLTMRSNNGINGVATIDIFIDVPVQSLGINLTKTSISETSLFVNEVMTLKEPIFYPEKSKNPSKVSEGEAKIVKQDKEYVYKVEFKLMAQTSTGPVETWIDIDSSDSLNTDKNRVVYWTSAQKNAIVAKKIGEFRIKAYAFDTYEEQDKVITSEQEAEKLERMRAVSEVKYFTITEVDYQSITAKNTSVNLTYKENGVKLYLRTNKTKAQLESENAINLDMQVNPNPNYGISEKDLYSKLQNVYVTSNLLDTGSMLKIYGNEAYDVNGDTQLYPYVESLGGYESDINIEYYYILDVVGLQSPDFNLIFNIVNPNTNNLLKLNVRVQISATETTVFGFVKPSSFNGVGHYESISMTQVNNKPALNVTIDASENPGTNYVDLKKFVVNKADGDKQPTYDKIHYYVYLGSNLDECNINREKIASIVDIVSTDYIDISSNNEYCVEISNGIIYPLSLGSFTVFAVLVRTDYYGNEIINNLTGTALYQYNSMQVSINVDLRQVNLEMLDENLNELEGEYLQIKENYEYNIRITPYISDNPTDISLLENNLDKIKFVISNKQVIENGPISYGQEGFYYYPIKVAKLTANPEPVYITCYLENGDRDILLGMTEEYTIKSTAVKSLVITNDDYYSFTAYWNASSNTTIWRNTETGEELSGNKLDLNIKIDGENQNYDIQISDRTAINAIIQTKKAVLELLKPADEVITITAVSMEDSAFSDSIQIRLLSANVEFDVSKASRNLGKSLSIDASGDVLENGVTFSEVVYKGNEVDLFDRISVVCGTEQNCNGLLSFEFETNVDCAKFDTVIKSKVMFIKNVSTSQNITIVVKSLFGQTMKYRFLLSNYISVELIDNLPYNESISSVGGSYQDRPVMSLYNGSEYITFVWYKYKNGNYYNKLDFSALLNIESKSGADISGLTYSVSRVNDGRGLIGIDSHGVITTIMSGNMQVSGPQVVYVELSEYDGEEQVFNKQFPILLVPNLRVQTHYNDDDKIVFDAGEYLFTQDIQNSYAFEDSGDLTINLNNLFIVKDFSNHVINGATVAYELLNPTGNASVSNGELVVYRDKVYADTVITIKQTLVFNGATFISEALINIEPYYGIYVDENSNVLIDGTKDCIRIYTGQSIKLTDIINVMNDTLHGIEDNITYSIIDNENTVITIREAGSNQAKISGTTYSGDYFAKVSLRINGKDTGFVLKVQVVHDIGVYAVNYGYISSEEHPINVSSNQKIAVNDIFNAKKISNPNTNVPLTFVVSDTNFAYVDNSNRLCFYPTAYAKLITLRATTGLVGMEDLICVFEVEPSQSMHISYKYDTNDIRTLSEALYSDDETAIGAFGYFELKAFDRIDIKDYVQAYNTLNGNVEDIFYLLSFEVQEYNFTSGEWVSSNLYRVLDLSTTPYIRPTNNYVDPTFTRVKITTSGGLIGYLNVLLATSSTISDESNVTITLSYPANSSNYYEDNLTYECVTADTIIDLTSYDELNNRRVYAEFDRRNVTDTLVFSFEAYDITTLVAYAGDGIIIDGSVITISNEVPIGTIIKVYMHNSYQMFANAYNIYVGGDAVIKFKNALINKGGESYNSSITYDAVNTNNNIIELSSLFTITNLAGEIIEMGSSNVNIELIGGTNTVSGIDYNFASLITSTINGKQELFINIDNFARQGGQIVTIAISVTDASGVETNANYLLKVAPSITVFRNADGSQNTITNPYRLLGKVSGATEVVLYSSTIDIIDTSVIIANMRNIAYTVENNVRIQVEDDNLIIVNNPSRLVFKANKDVLAETLTQINIVTTWGRVMPFYVLLLPKEIIESNNVQLLSAYSLTDYSLFETNNNNRLQLLTYDSIADEYVVQSFDGNKVVIEAYVDGQLIDMTKVDALVKVNNQGVLSFGAVRQNTVLEIKVYFESERGKENKQSEQVLNLVLMPNFNSADIVINVNGSENSIDNPIHLTDDGFYLTDLMEIKRYVDSSISTYRYPTGVKDIIKTFRFESDILQFDNVNNYKVQTKNNYTSSTDTVAVVDMYVYDDAVFKTFFVLVDANYSFMPVKDLTVVYDGYPLNLSYMSDYFVGSDGNKIVGGNITFSAVEENSDLFTINNNILTVKNGLGQEEKIKLIATYSVDGLSYIGAVDIILEPKYSIQSKSDTINIVNYFEYDDVEKSFRINNSNNKLSRATFINSYFTVLKGNNKVEVTSADIDNGIYNITCEEIQMNVGGNYENVYRITVQSNEVNANIISASTYVKVASSNEAYYYSSYENVNVFVGGDTINLLNVVGEFKFAITDEVILPYNSLSYTFMNLETGDLILDNLLVTEFTTKQKVYELLIAMTAQDSRVYLGVANVLVYPSVNVNLIYTEAGQGITIAKAGQKLSLKDYILFSPQRPAVRDRIQDNINTNYEIFLFDKNGQRVVDDLNLYYELIDGATDSENPYSAINPILDLKILADGYIFIVKASMAFDDGTLTAYYYIKVDGISYAFNTINGEILKEFGENDELTLDDFGSFSVGSVTDVKFTSIGSYYEIINNCIKDTKNLYDIDVEVLISAKFVSGDIVRDLFAIGKFKLKTKYIIDNYVDSEGEHILSFDVLTTIKRINLLSSNYINKDSVNAYELLATVTINTFDTNNRQVLGKTYNFKGEDGLLSGRVFNENYYNLYSLVTDPQLLLFEQLENVDLTDMYIVVQLQYKSLNQYKYIQYKINFVTNLAGVTILSEDDTYDLTISYNDDVDLSTLKVYDSETLLNDSQYKLEFKLTNDYCYLQEQGGKTYLKAYPFFTDRNAQLTVTAFDLSDNFIGQGYLSVKIKGVSINDNNQVCDMSTDGVKYKIVPTILGELYSGDFSVSGISSVIYNKQGSILIGQTYLDYLRKDGDYFKLIENMLVPEYVTISLTQEVTLSLNGQNYDTISYNKVINIPESIVALYIDGQMKAQDIRTLYTYNVTALKDISVDFRVGTRIIQPNLQLLTPDLSNAISIVNGMVRIKELYANAVATISASNSTNSLQTVIDIKFNDYDSFDYDAQSVQIVEVGDETTIDDGDSIALIRVSDGQEVNNAIENVYSKVSNKLKVLKAGYIIIVKVKTGIIINSQNIDSVKIYKTIEKRKDYDILVDDDASCILDIMTTNNNPSKPSSFKKDYNLSFEIDGEVKNAEYEITDIIGNKVNTLSNYLSFDLTDSTLKLEYTYEPGFEGARTVGFTLCAEVDGVKYFKNYLVNIRSPFIVGQEYFYEFTLDDFIKYGNQLIIDLNNFKEAFNGYDLTMEADVEADIGKIDVDMGVKKIYAHVPSYNITYRNHMATITGESGYTAKIIIDYSYFVNNRIQYYVGTNTINIKVNPLSGNLYSSSYSYDGTNATLGSNNTITVDFENGKTSFNVETRETSTGASLLVNNIQFDTQRVGVGGSVHISNLRDITLDGFAIKPTATNDGGVLQYSFTDNGKTSTRTKMFVMFTADWEINGETSTRTYVVPVTFKGSFNRNTNLYSDLKNDEEVVRNVEMLSPYGVSTTESRNVSIQLLKAVYPELSKYSITLECIDIGYNVTSSGIQLHEVQNTGVVYLKIIAEIENKVKKLYLLPIVRSNGTGNQFKYIVKDDVDTYNRLSDYKSTLEQNSEIKQIIGLSQDAIIDVTVMPFENDYLLFNIKQTFNGSIMNKTPNYYLLEVRNTNYVYSVNYDVEFTDIEYARIPVQSLIMGETGETVISVVCDDEYQNCVTTSNQMLIVKPTFKDIIVPVNVVTKIGDLFRYYCVNINIKAVEKEKAKEIFDVTVNPEIIRGGNAYELPIPYGYDDYDFEWKFIYGNGITINTNTISVSGSAPLQTICANLYVKAVYGEYTFAHFIDIVDNSFSAKYTQNVFNAYASERVNLDSLGDWVFKYNGATYTLAEIGELFHVTTTYTLVNSANYSINGNLLNTFNCLVDNTVNVKCTVEVTGIGVYEKLIYLKVLSGVQFVAGYYDVSQNSLFGLITESHSTTDTISDFRYTILSATRNGEQVDSSVVTLQSGKLKIEKTANEGNIKFEIKVEDALNNSRILRFTLHVLPNDRQYFEYVARETVSIKSGDSYKFDKSIGSIGEFKLLATTIDNELYEEQTLNNATGYDFVLNYNGSLLDVVNKTIYAGNVLDTTLVTLQVVLYNVSDEYLGYINVEISPRYKFEKVNNETIYEVEPNTTLNVGDLVNIYKNDVLISSCESEGINMSYSFITEDAYGSLDLPRIIDNKTIYFGFNNAGQLYKLRIAYDCNGEVKEIYYIISVGAITYNIDVKSDIYNIYSGQSLDLTKCEYNFYDKEGYLIEIDKSRLSFERALGSEDYYTIRNGILTAEKSFNSVVTSFVVKYGNNLKGEVALTINATYELSMNDKFNVYAGQVCGIDFTINDIFRKVDVTNSTQFRTELIIQNVRYGSVRGFILDYKYAKQTVNGEFRVLSSNGLIEYEKRNISINVLQSRFVSLVSSGVYINDNFISSSGQDLLKLIKVVNQNGDVILPLASDFSVDLIAGDSDKFTNVRDLVYTYQPTGPEIITIRITDKLTGDKVDYTCIVSA